MHEAAEYERMTLDLASALCARLCHDISSPLGTLAGTLEMAVEDPAEAGEALGLANEAAGWLAARLRLLRAAWAGDCGPLTRSGLTALAAGLPHRVAADVAGLPDGPFDGPAARLLLNLLLLGADALPRGGVVALSGDPAGGVVLSPAGPAVSWHAALGPALADPAGPILAEPRTVQIPLTVHLAHAAGLRLSFLLGPPGAGPPRLLLAPP